MLTPTQKSTTVLALGHLVPMIHAQGDAPSPEEISRINMIVAKIAPEHQIEDYKALRTLAIESMEALTADIH